MSEKYFGNFDGREGVAREFEVGADRNDFPSDSEILLASYSTPSYEGYAFVLFERDGKLYEVNGSHCSCYGLEGQWEPEETSWEAIAARWPLDTYEEHGKPADDVLAGLLAAHGLVRSNDA